LKRKYQKLQFQKRSQQDIPLPKYPTFGGGRWKIPV
jgi:hypothetical protein